MLNGSAAGRSPNTCLYMWAKQCTDNACSVWDHAAVNHRQSSADCYAENYERRRVASSEWQWQWSVRIMKDDVEPELPIECCKFFELRWWTHTNSAWIGFSLIELAFSNKTVFISPQAMSWSLGHVTKLYEYGMLSQFTRRFVSFLLQSFIFASWMFYDYILLHPLPASRKVCNGKRHFYFALLFHWKDVDAFVNWKPIASTQARQ